MGNHGPLENLEVEVPHTPESPLLSARRTEMKSFPQKDTCAPTFTAVPFVNVGPAHTPCSEWTDKEKVAYSHNGVLFC